jgi:hypothetical protein
MWVLSLPVAVEVLKNPEKHQSETPAVLAATGNLFLLLARKWFMQAVVAVVASMETLVVLVVLVAVALAACRTSPQQRERTV